MSTLTSAPVASLLDQLFRLDSTWPPISLAGVSDQEIEMQLLSRSECLGLYAALKDVSLAISRETGSLLYMLVRGLRAKTIVEFGTSFGVSALHLAAALKDTGGGLLISSEFEPDKVLQAKRNVVQAGLVDFVEIREGDALVTLSDAMPPTIDMVFLDGAKPLYQDVLKLLEPKMRAGTLVVADDANYTPEYLAYVRTPANGYMSLALGSNVELSLRIV